MKISENTQHLLRNTSGNKEKITAIFDRNLNYIYINDLGCAQLQTVADKIIGNNIIDMYPAIIASKNHRNLLKAGNGIIVYDTILSRKNELFLALIRRY